MDEQMQQQIVQLVQAAMQGDQQAQQQVQQIMQAAQQGDPQAQQIAQLIQQVAEQLQGQQTQMMRFGAKLNYIKYLRGKCPEGYEMQYFKNGGKAGCKKCQKKEEGGDVIANFKCGRKMKKKCEQGSSIEMNGKKMKKSKYGSKVEKAQRGTDLENPYNIQTYNDLNEYVKKRKQGVRNLFNPKSSILSWSGHYNNPIELQGIDVYPDPKATIPTSISSDIEGYQFKTPTNKKFQ